MNSANLPKSSAGHTLVEICIVICLLGLILGSSMNLPFGHQVPAARGAQLLGRLISSLAERARTVGWNARMEFVLGTGKAQSCLEVSSGTECQPNSIREFSLPEGIFVDRARFAGAGTGETLRLYPSGAASPGRLILRSTGGESCVIVVSLWGAQTVVCSSPS